MKKITLSESQLTKIIKNTIRDVVAEQQTPSLPPTAQDSYKKMVKCLENKNEFPLLSTLLYKSNPLEMMKMTWLHLTGKTKEEFVKLKRCIG